MWLFDKTIERAARAAVEAALEELQPQLATFTKRYLLDAIENDPEVRTLMRRTMKQHLENMRDDLIAIERSNRDLGERLADFFTDFDDIQLRVATLERACAQTAQSKPQPVRAALPAPEGAPEEGRDNE